MSTRDMPVTAFALSLIGGILMLISGLLPLIVFLSGGYGYGYGYGGMMGGFGGMMGGWGGLWFIGVVSGIVVVIGALMLNARQAEYTTWGYVDNCLFNYQFIWYGRLLHWCNTRHSWWRSCSKLETLTKSLKNKLRKCV